MKLTFGCVSMPPTVEKRVWLVRLGLLALVMTVNLVLARFALMLPGGHLAFVTSTLAPSTWLLAASLVLWMQWHPGVSLLRGGQRAVLWAGLLVALAILLLAGLLVLAKGGEKEPGEAASSLVATGGLVLLVPLAEECYFRGILLDHLKSTMGTWTASALVSLLFGLLHLQTAMTWPMVGLSLFLCLSVVLGGGVLWAVGFHMLWNALSVFWRGGSDGQWGLLLLLTGLPLLVTIGILTRDRPEQESNA